MLPNCLIVFLSVIYVHGIANLGKLRFLGVLLNVVNIVLAVRPSVFGTIAVVIIIGLKG